VTIHTHQSTKRSLLVSLNTLVTSLVHSRMDYCNVEFPACYIQRCSRFSIHPYDLSLDRHNMIMLLLCYATITVCPSFSAWSTNCSCCPYGDAPSYLVDLSKPSVTSCMRARLRSGDSKTVAVPRTLSSLGDRSCTVTGPHASNKLPTYLH